MSVTRISTCSRARIGIADSELPAMRTRKPSHLNSCTTGSRTARSSSPLAAGIADDRTIDALIMLAEEFEAKAASVAREGAVGNGNDADPAAET